MPRYTIISGFDADTDAVAREEAQDAFQQMHGSFGKLLSFSVFREDEEGDLEKVLDQFERMERNEEGG